MPFRRAWGGWRWQLWVPAAARQPRAQPRAPGWWLEVQTRPRHRARSSSRGVFGGFQAPARDFASEREGSSCAKLPQNMQNCPCRPHAPFLGRALDFFDHLPVAFILCAWKSLPSWWPFIDALMRCRIAAPLGGGGPPSPGGFNPSPPSLLLPPVCIYIPGKRSSVGVRRREDGFSLASFTDLQC